MSIDCSFVVIIVIMILQEIFFKKSYMLSREMKTFNLLLDNKQIVSPTNKNKQEANEKLVELPRVNYYTIGNLLHYLYHQKYYKQISRELSRQIDIKVSQKISSWED